MARNGVKTGGGSRKGRPNKNTAKTRDELWKYVEENGKTNPLQFLIDTVNDPKIDYTLRIQCANTVLPYMASKLQPVDPASGQAEQRISVRVTLTGPGDES